MAEMLVDGAKLDACNTAEADAIRAKTGGSSPIPYDYANNKGFADAIAAIPSGGGDPWELIADYTSDENAALVVATIPDGKQNANVYKVEFSNGNSSGIGYYPRMQVNAVVAPYGADAQSPRTCTGYIARRTPNNLSGTAKSAMFGSGNSVATAPYPITQIGLSGYNNNNVIKAGTRVKVWRLVEP